MASEIELTFDTRAAEHYMSQLRSAWPRGAQRGLQEVGQRVLQQSVGMAPHLKGGLAGSARMQTRETAEGYVVEISFSAPYALAVHYRRGVRHPQGRRLFLTVPMRRNEGDIDQTVTRHMDQEAQALG